MQPIHHLMHEKYNTLTNLVNRTLNVFVFIKMRSDIFGVKSEEIGS